MNNGHDRRLRFRLRYVLPALIASAFIALSAFWIVRIYVTQDRVTAQQIESCERGNVLRRHLQVIEALHAAELPANLEVIRLYPCATLR